MTSFSQSIVLPPFVRKEFFNHTTSVFESDEDKMDLVIRLAAVNYGESGGGPFAAAVFDMNSQLVSLGVNLTVPQKVSFAHAEFVAVFFANRAIDTFSFSQQYDLVTSCEPCSMCIGLAHWAKFRRIVCGASEEDAIAVGFDEGQKPLGWIQNFERRGTKVITNVLREKARKVFTDYAEKQGKVY